ncbi:MAG TPA: protein kinase [Bryobacteraceae bacterium]|nr:protein kinase [Bryobacteraceae bacterium]
MNDKAQWTRLERVFHAALAREPGQRAGYIRAECGDDEELRRRIESLLGQDSGPAGTETWAESSGPGIGPYRVLSKLGAGGMGEVYLALDSRLGRHVAVKVMPPRFAADPERKRRLSVEARAASALNHPNIVTVYDVGSDRGLDYFVMEYVPGKPLDRLIPRNGLKLHEALGYAVQIADALACAHSAGIVHRDLKPANVVVTETGVAKVLDFGLAKLTPPLATQTNAGMIVGTLAYMSPEQAAGSQIDARSDIFSFGSMLYEMTTGRRPFQRDSAAATLAAIVNDEPPSADKITEDVPPAMAAVIERCMRKDPGERFGSPVELTAALTAIRDRPTVYRDAPEPKKRVRWIVPIVAAVLVATAWTTFFSWRDFSRRQPEPSTTLAVAPLTTYPFHEYTPTFSPDGSQVAFAWQGPKGDNTDIYVKVVGEDEPVRLTKDPQLDGTPAWSPDGRWIAFLRHLTQAPSYLEHGPEVKSAVVMIPATGGPERKIAEINPTAGLCLRISWDPSSRWLVISDKASPGDSQSLNLLSRDGERRRLTFPPQNIEGDVDPSFSPDGRSIAFVRGKVEGIRDVYVLRFADDFTPIGEPVRLTFDDRPTSSPAWSADGRSIVYSSGSFHNPRLWRIWIPQSGTLPKPAELLAFAGHGAGSPAISRQGRLAFMSSPKDADIQRLDLVGSPADPHAPNPPVTVIASSRLDHTPQDSPDGSRIAFASDRSGSHEIWVCDRDGSNGLPVTSFGGPYTANPFWSPDGRWLAFGSRPEGRHAAYLVSPGGGAPKRLTGTEIDAGVAGWSRDGKWIYLTSRPINGPIGANRIWKVSPDGGAPVPVTQGPGDGRAIESPDGRFLFFLQNHDPIGTLWRMRLPSGEPEEILDAVYGLNFAVTDTGVFFIASASQASIRFLRFADRQVMTVASLGRSVPAYGMSLAPDGRSLLLPVFIDHPVDLMLVENFR